MNPLKSFGRWMVKKKIFDPFENIDVDLNRVVGWRSIGGSGSYGYYKSNQYENGYSSISKLSNAFSMIEPYAIDKSGKMVASNVIDRLYTPNNQMSAFDFREALAVMTLVHDKVRIRVHHSTTRITADSIKGFTFMEDYTENIVDGKYQYRLENGETLTDDEVITLKAINPEDLNQGFSPSRAARRWTTIDDYIADYQTGFFRNGAVPAGQMVITAPTATEFNDIVDMLQARHKGAGKNNNITYTHRPTDQNGAPLNSQIEWVPFSSQNKDMALKDLFDNANKKIDSVYGVPASIRGVNEANTYASVRVDELIFNKYALSPMTLKIWSKFTHELTRITGGMGIAITYKLELPKLADEELVNAQSRQTDAATVATLVEQGFELDSAIEYVKLGDLSSLIKSQVEDVDEPEITDTEEIKDTPDQPVDAFSKAIDAFNNTVEQLAKHPEVKEKQITPQVRREYETQLAVVVRRQDERQINRAVNEVDSKSKAIGDVDQDEVRQFTTEMVSVLMPLVVLEGITQRDQGVQLILQAGLNASNISDFQLTPEQRQTYRAYLEKVGLSHSTTTSQYIREVLDQAAVNQWTAQEIKDKLSQYLAEEWRIDRVVVTEVNKAGTTGAVNSMINIADETGYKIEKVWEHYGSDTPCEFCQVMIGRAVDVRDDFVPLGETVAGTQGGVFTNDFDPITAGDIHPNGHCGQTYKVRS